MAPHLNTFESVTKAPDTMTMDFISLAISNEAMFHALMAFSSARVDATDGRQMPSYRTLLHTGSAIRQLNAALNDMEQTTSDAIIAAVCLVGGSHVSENNLCLRPTFRSKERPFIATL